MNSKSFFSAFLCLSLSSLAMGQSKDSLQKVQIQSVQTTLGADENTAKQAATIMNAYKSKAAAVAADNSLSSTEKKAKFDALIDDKNTKLSRILSTQQLKKIVPTTELNKN